MNIFIHTFLILLLTIPAGVSAAVLFFDSEHQEYGIGQIITVDILLDTQAESLNAIESEIIYPKNLLEFVGFETGSSVIVHWIVRPEQSGEVISFSGIIPGGFNGLIDALIFPRKLPGPILKMKFKALEIGSGELTFDNSRALRNDGEGTPVQLSTSSQKIKIGSYTEIIDMDENQESIPVFMEVMLQKEKEMFNGKYFITFQATDKVYGISHYEVKEEGSEWVRSETPYLLHNQEGLQVVLVKAINYNGDETIFELRVGESNLMYNILLAFASFVLLVIILLVSRALRKK